MYDFYFEGEDLDGNYIYFESDKPMTINQAKKYAKDTLLSTVRNGHIDAFITETDAFVFDVEN